MAYKQIDKMPPAMTGDVQEDARNLRNYISDVVDQINYLVSMLNRKEINNG